MTTDLTLPKQYHDLAHLGAFGMIITGEAGAFQFGMISRVFFEGERVVLKFVDGESVLLNEADTKYFLEQTKQIATAALQQRNPGLIATPKIKLH